MANENNVTINNNSSDISVIADTIPEFHNSTIDHIWNDDATFFGKRITQNLNLKVL